MSIRIQKADGHLTRAVYADEAKALRALKRRKEVGAAVVWCKYGNDPKVWLHRYENDGVHSLDVATGKFSVTPHKA